MEIILIIFREHLQRLCNKYFLGILREFFNVSRQLVFQCQEKCHFCDFQEVLAYGNDIFENLILSNSSSSRNLLSNIKIN